MDGNLGRVLSLLSNHHHRGACCGEGLVLVGWEGLGFGWVSEVL